MSVYNFVLNRRLLVFETNTVKCTISTGYFLAPFYFSQTYLPNSFATVIAGLVTFG
jgi:hypothetical protein